MNGVIVRAQGGASIVMYGTVIGRTCVESRVRQV